MSGTVLLVDDDKDGLVSLERALQGSGCEHTILTASSSDQALLMAHRHNPNVAVIDLCLDPRRGVASGQELMVRLLSIDAAIRIIVLTGHGGAEQGVGALMRGAAHFLEKPAAIEHLLVLINDGMGQSKLRRDYQSLISLRSRDLTAAVVGAGSRMRAVQADIEAASTHNQPVLFVGETGTGKGLCALTLHRLSGRANQSFIRYQPNRGSADLVQSDLFGHVQGAFTGARGDRKGLLAEAHGGSFFLDEVDELPQDVQVSLLGVLQDKGYRAVGSNRELIANVRFVAATNQSLEKSLDSGKMRRDFYYRLAHCVIELPPLRERIEDLPSLMTHVLRTLHEKEGVRVFDFDQGVVERLSDYSWPGNIRELQGMVEGAAFRAQRKGRERLEALDFNLPQGSTSRETLPFHERVHQFQGRIVRDALASVNGNQLKAARVLGVDRGTLKRILLRSSDSTRGY